MTTLILLASILVVFILAWLFRQRLFQYLPRKESMTTALSFAPIALLVTLALLPDIVTVMSTMKLMPPAFRIVLALAAAVVACVGCSKQPDPPKPIHWSASETGYQAETPPPPDNKEGP